MDYYERHKNNKDTEKAEGFSKGEKVASYWYRPTSLGKARFNARPKAAVVLRLNSDETYTVELSADGSIIDDVPAENLKYWSEANDDLRLDATSHKEREIVGKWSAVIELAKSLQKSGKIRKQHEIPTIDSVKRMGKDLDDLDKLKAILAEDAIEDFIDAYREEDSYKDKELPVGSVVRAFCALGGKVSASEVRDTSRRLGMREPYSYRIDDFIIVYANTFFESALGNISDRDLILAGKSLRLSGEWKNLAGFAKSFGKRLFQNIERNFDLYATKDSQGVSKIFAREILEIFHKLGYAITVTRLQDWMSDSDVRPQDTLTLADLASVFAFFFNPTSMDIVGEEDKIPANKIAQSTLSEIAILTLQEERWRGSLEQTVSFIRRLSVGRSDTLIDMIGKIRDSFESLDLNKDGEISSTNVGDMFKRAVLTSVAIDLTRKNS